MAQRSSRRPHSRTWTTLPGPDGASWVYKVWIESTMANAGRHSSRRTMIRSTSVSERRKMPSPEMPSRWERNLIWWGDSSPLAYITDWAVDDIYWAICNNSVDLPTPGSPASSETEPGTIPPPSTRFNSAEGKAILCWSSEFSWDNSCKGSAVAPTQECLEAGLAGATLVSDNGPPEPHPGEGQKPIHLELSYPQSKQRKTVRCCSLGLGI